MPATDPTPGPAGRFAPSPSGPLHAGSLIAALASYLDARARGHRWLVRIEDIDPPREQPGADRIILRQLENHGLYWDEPVSYQSQHSWRYQSALTLLENAGLTYHCDCTRKAVRARGPHYDGRCRDRQLPPGQTVIRLRNDHPVTGFQDDWQGAVTISPTMAAEDFILRRKGELWAYQLAVVCDDYAQGVTTLVRGADLLHPTAWQLTLWRELSRLQFTGVERPWPRLLHVPLLTDAEGRKVSKQNQAPALPENQAVDNLRLALQRLGLRSATTTTHSRTELLRCATAEWAERFSLA